MNPIVYGQKPTREKIKSEVRMVVLINMLLVFAFYPVIILYLPLPTYAFLIYMPLHLLVVILWRQHKDNKTYDVFDKDAIHIFTYSKWLYLDLLRNKEAKETIIPYQDITACEMTYHKNHKKSRYLYGIQFHLTTSKGVQDLTITLAELSEKKLKQLLMLLSNKISNFEDPYQLYLCLLQQYVTFDTYVERIKGRALYENK